MGHSGGPSDRAFAAADVPNITPFWQRLPLFFRYPLHWEPLLYMVFLAAATTLSFVLPVPSPFDYLIVLAGVWLAFIRYAYTTLDQTAHGLMRPDQHSLHLSRDRNALPYKQYAIFVVFGFAVELAQSMGSLIHGAVLIFVLLALPASVINLALSRSFWAGLNPLGAVRLIRVIGLPYLGLCAFLFLLSASEEVLKGFLVSHVSPWLLLPAFNFVAMYFTLGESLWRSDVPDLASAEVCLQRALTISHNQRAMSLKLRAAMSLAQLWQLQGRLHDAKTILEAVYHEFTEGFDTPDLRAARKLLNRLAA